MNWPGSSDARSVAQSLLGVDDHPFKLLVDDNPTAFLLGEIAFHDGSPVNATIIYANRAYERHLERIQNHALKSWGAAQHSVPNTRWLTTRADVLTSGIPRSFTHYQRASRHWLDVYTFAVTNTVFGEYLRDVTDPSSRGGVATFDGLTINYAGREVLMRDQPVALTRTEFDILARLSRTPGAVVPTEDLLTTRDDIGWSANEASIGIHVSRLRAKLGESATAPRHIVTARGVGYRFEP